nr:MAG TPA: hypothetical protein [Caudoviricetes sp.]
MNLFEEVEIIKRLIKEENKKKNKLLEDIASSLKKLNEILKNSAESKIATRWIVKIKFYTMDSRYHHEVATTIIATSKGEALKKAQERYEDTELRRYKTTAEILTAEDIIINESEKPNGNN